MDIAGPSAGETVEVVEGVHITQLVAGERASAQHLRIEPGATVPEHDHPHEQLGYVLRGEQTFYIDGETYVVGAGESYVLPGDVPHASANEGEGDLEAIDVFSPPRPNPDWAP